MPHRSAPFLPLGDTVMVVPWNDPVVDAVGHDAGSRYVELFWLNVLGPSALWALRRLTMGLERYPLGYELELADTAAAMGLSYTAGTSNTFVRALQRCVLFGVAQPVPDGLAVRRRIPPVAARHLARMPEALQQQHRSWQVRECTLDDLQRGCLLGEAMLAAGDDPDDVERQLLSVGVGPVAAGEAVALLLRQAA